MRSQNVAVIGAGGVGRQLAAIFANAGFETTLEDILPSNLRKAAEYLSSASGLSRVRFASSIEEAVRDADLIVDCVPDELESKLEIFSLLDRMAPPHSILLTPTRCLSIADLASCTYRGDRCIAVELPLGELPGDGRLTLISTSLTSPEVLDAVSSFCGVCKFIVSHRIDQAEASVAAGTLF